MKNLPLLPPSEVSLLPPFFFQKSCCGSKRGETFFPFTDSPAENLAEGWQHLALYFPFIYPGSE